MKKARKNLLLCLVLVIILSLLIFSAIARADEHKDIDRADDFDEVGGYRATFVLDFNEYPEFKNTWLYEVAENDELEIRFAMQYNSPVMIISGKDEKFAIKGKNFATAKKIYENPHGAYQFYSPYLDEKNRKQEYYLQGDEELNYYPANMYRAEETTDAEIRQKYAKQLLIVTMEENSGDSRIKFWGTEISPIPEEVKIEKTDKIIFDWNRRPHTEIIRVDKESSFVEENYAKDNVFNTNEDSRYYRGCEGFDGEYEWEEPPVSDIICYKVTLDENGQEIFTPVSRLDSRDNPNWTRAEAIEYFKANYEIVSVTDPISPPDLTPTAEDLRRQELAKIDERYPSDEYLIDDEDLKSGFKEKNIDQYGKYKDSDGNVHKITALNGKVSYETFKSELIGVARFKLFNNTAAWFDKVSSNGWADVEIRHYSVDLWVDEILVDENDETYFMCIKGDLGEQWFMELSTATKAKGERGNEWIQDSNYQTQTDEGYYNFEPVCEFSEEYIDMFTDGEKNFEVIVKFESEDKLEIESVVLKRLGSVMYTAPGEDIQADLGFRMHFFEDSFGEDGRLYKQNFPDDYDRLISDYNAYVEKYKDVVIDVNQEFKHEEIKKEDEVKDDKPVDPNKEIDVFVNGNKLELDVAPIIVNERTMVPMRAIFEALGAEVTWFGETQTVTAEKDDIKITLQINSNVMYKNDEVIELDAPAALYNNRTLVPVRTVSEAFEKEVVWDAAQRTVTVN